MQRNKTFSIITIICFCSVIFIPIGLVLMWYTTLWTKKRKLILSGIMTVVYVGIVCFLMLFEPNQSGSGSGLPFGKGNQNVESQYESEPDKSSKKAKQSGANPSAKENEDIFQKDRYKKGQHWHTIEGAFYFKEGDWQYVMYSGNCYEQPTYYIGYARAKTDETDLTKIKFEKYPDDDTYAPVLSANEFEEGTGHHSMIKKDGQWYAIYHARDYDDGLGASAFDARNARICKLNVKDGIITAERYKDKI